MATPDVSNRVHVGPLLPPPGTYTFTPATPPLSSPGGEPLAQLARVPSSLGAFVGTAFPPFGRLPLVAPAHLAPPEERISYRIVGLVQYRGDEGEIIVETIAPSPAALAMDLVLGNPVGAASGGFPLAAMTGHHVRWQQGNLIIDIIGTLPMERLKALAADVVLS